MNNIAINDGLPTLRLVAYRDGLFDVTDGLKRTLNYAPLQSHEEAMDFIVKWAHDNEVKNIRYTLVEAVRE